MFKRNNKQFTKRIISILFLIHISYIVNKDNEKLDFFEVTDQNFQEKSTFERIIPDNLNQVREGLHEELYMGLFDSQECLHSKVETAQILKENGIQYNYNDNLRFVLGKCDPVVMVPGLYSTRLMMQIDCKKFRENRENLINMKLFCGESICKKDYEEHVMWPALYDSPFSLRVTEDNKYSSCFGYFFKFYNSNTECPEFESEKKEDKFLGEPEKSKSVCLHDDSVRVTFYGGTENTKKQSQCGIKSIKNIVSVGSTPLPESWVNSGAPKAFENMYDRLYEMGYRPGFSMAGIPFDFRRFVSTNGEFKKILKNQIERLYNNTNRKVVIVAHSYGSSNALDELIGDDEVFLSKIKKFIAIAPPFAGSAVAVDILLHGSKDFDTKVSIRGYDIIDVEFDEFAQKIVSPSSPVIYELKPNSVMFKLFQDEKYARFKDAILERIYLERKCKEIDCDSEEIVKNSLIFNRLFKREGDKNMFPTFVDDECRLKRILDNPEYHQRIEEFNKITKRVPNFFPCRYDFYDIVNCPTIVKRAKEDEKAAEMIEQYCIKKEEFTSDNLPLSELFDPSSSYFNYECNDNSQCLDSFLDEFSPYPYLNDKMVYLIDRFYNNYREQFPDVIINSENFFESKENFTGKIKAMIDHQYKISKTRNLDIPKVDTIIVYGSFLPTKTAFLFDSKKNQQEFEYIDILSKGGDGTVSSWSSLLVGLKWLYDKHYQEKDKILPQNIQLVEYCSPLSTSGDEFHFNKNSEVPQEFSVLSCDCLDSDGLYKTKEVNGGKCDHTNMISDRKVLKFLEDIIIDEKSQIDEDRINTARNFRHDLDYEDDCNSALLKIVNEGE